MPLWNFTVAWHLRDGTERGVSVSSTHSREQALSEALKLAKEDGWTPPRWWQWWRWGDRNYEAA